MNCVWGWEGKVLLKKRLVNDKKAEGAMKLTHTLTNLVPLVLSVRVLC